MARRCFLSLALLSIAALACNSKDDGARTPEQVARDGKEGSKVVVEGTVHALTFDQGPRGGDFMLLPDRWLLLRSVVPPGVKVTDTMRADLPVAWGLGVHLPEGKLAGAQLPQLGDRVRVTGTFRRVTWNGRPMLPVLEDATIEDLTVQPPLAMEGAECATDMDCHERLLCDRGTRRCVTSNVPDWDSPVRNVNGACVTDADCPLGQHCDLRHVVPATGPYAPPYFKDRDAGKSLCVLEEGTTLASLCPRYYTVTDLVGGRLVSGKEACLEADVWLPVAAEDGDTHLQLVVPEPLPYPSADIPYYVFGFASENVPPYKDPARPQGSLVDPVKDEHVKMVGTIRFDPSHGWWELHPIKLMIVEPAAGKAAPHYPGRPATIDPEVLEEE